jgi:hypothetical protein
MPAFQPYRGKPAVRNDREGRGNVGIMRSPVRASTLPDCGGRDENRVPTATASPVHHVVRRRGGRRVETQSAVASTTTGGRQPALYCAAERSIRGCLAVSAWLRRSEGRGWLDSATMLYAPGIGTVPGQRSPQCALTARIPPSTHPLFNAHHRPTDLALIAVVGCKKHALLIRGYRKPLNGTVCRIPSAVAPAMRCDSVPLFNLIGVSP